MIAVIDYGCQYTQLVARRIREQNVFSEILSSETAFNDILNRKPAALILSGGPSSVFGHEAPEFDEAILDADFPILGICYGLQLLAHHQGGSVESTGHGEYGFATPLATLHKFNGWSDQFLATPKEGLADLYASVGGKLAGGKWALIYHKFDADEASLTVDDLGSEINALYTKSFTKNYSAGIKFASYSAGDVGAGKVDTDKIWLWTNVKF